MKAIIFVLYQYCVSLTIIKMYIFDEKEKQFLFNTIFDGIQFYNLVKYIKSVLKIY